MNFIIFGFLFFALIYGFLWLMANAKSETFSTFFRLSTIITALAIIVGLFVAGKYLLSLPFFAILSGAIKKRLLNVFNIIYLYRLLSTILFYTRTRPNQNFRNSYKEVNTAYSILGLSRNCTKKDIIEAHRRLIKKTHPDMQGSTEEASKINRARDILLKIHQ